MGEDFGVRNGFWKAKAFFYFSGRNYGVHNDRQQHSHHHGHGHNPDEDDGFDEHYFRRRPKSVCMSANTTADGRRFIPPTYGGAGLPPNAASAHLPPHNLGIPTEPFQPASLEDHHRMTMVSPSNMRQTHKIVEIVLL